MCDCINEINAKLAPDHCVDATMAFRSGEVSIAMIGLIRRDKWRREDRRSKPSFIVASHCPWCGEKYPVRDALPSKNNEAA